MSEVELPLCLAFNRANRRRFLSSVFALVSRLGDGVFWYAIIVALPFIYGLTALQTSLHMVLVGAVSLLLYKWLKIRTSRERPYRLHEGILQNVRALDEFSFPSGHTMHAVGFTIVLLGYYPEWWWLVVPFSSLVACSRLVLGLHYPSDVAAGAAIGASVALASLDFV
jgi:undecaprenyl-diphosphatase